MSLSMLAAAGGQDDILRLLIKKGVRVNGRQKNGTTALMHAAEKNFLTTVAILLEAGSYVNAQTLGGETALMKACKRGNADVVRLLLEYGADCNILSKHKNTAMYFAKLSNNLMVCDLIKDHISVGKLRKKAAVVMSPKKARLLPSESASPDTPSTSAAPNSHLTAATSDSESHTEDNHSVCSYSTPSAEDSSGSCSSAEEWPGPGSNWPSKRSPAVSSSSSSSESEDASTPAEDWWSKSGKIQWSQGDDQTHRYNPPNTPTAGPTRYACSRGKDIPACFDLFLTDEIIDIVLQYTNLQETHRSGWSVLEVTELRAFFGLLLLSGLYRSRGEAPKTLWSGEGLSRPIFAATMSRYRFEELCACLRFDDRKTRHRRRRQGKLAPISDLWQKWNNRLPMLFCCSEYVTVDEQMVGFRGRCSFRQYMKSKPQKYGIKLWVLADARTSYAVRVQPYTGKDGPTRPRGENNISLGQRVVHELTEGLPPGHTITMDNFFTSHALGEELAQRKLAMLGTIRRNKPELPPALLEERQREVLSSVFAHTPTCTAVSYMAKGRRKKLVLLLSTRHRQAEVSDEPHRKPVMILDYNRTKGGVDHLDQQVALYSCKRKTRRWPLCLFYNLLDISCYNAFVLWSHVNPDWKRGCSYRRRLFIEELGKALVTPFIQSRARLPRAPFARAYVEAVRWQAAPASAVGSYMEPYEGERERGNRLQCSLCPSRATTGKRQKRVSTRCCSCGKPVCKDHSFLVCKDCSS